MESIEQGREQVMREMEKLLAALQEQRKQIVHEIDQYTAILTIMGTGAINTPVAAGAEIVSTAVQKKVRARTKKRAVRRLLPKQKAEEKKTFVRSGREIRFFSAAEKKQILAHAKEHGAKVAADKFGAHWSTIYGWAAQARAKAKAQTRSGRGRKTKKARRGGKTTRDSAVSGPKEKYPLEFRFKMVSYMLGLEPGAVPLSASALARETNIAQSTLSRWFKLYREEVTALFSDAGVIVVDESDFETASEAEPTPPAEEVRSELEKQSQAQKVSEAKRAWGWNAETDS